ncbi:MULTISPECIES: MarR family winged helix-turn-helix transcriptional regulator [Peribacillus]|jgi:DNA-binding MarR family transcriptional regulator|uniref:MarR family winged helix-turn-helix transcriptional regulator n=1 Tax=Peribacillus TaxID=2675229 RepID=UPI000553AF97|nr:MarR family transcriptional regulator [Peribacillus frigoritolerans]MBT2602577.1 MarR family transcriptional regulator [Bacillus sp. ISL-53]MEB2493086.1 MarR family transcriptional regulator [Peribacillus frigoritolerans]MED3760473.1 MarR family transcriptional regulator [Peribacillus frigoritolerans]MED3833038.1 MarR family transcriptional regulator [Peribacillus frigoritolerans]MED3847446.1 MarR family transcriptional regulator [Peribacillus frigoritolerans]
MSSDNRLNSALLESLTHRLQRYGMRSVLFQQNMAQKIGVSHTDLKSAEILNETGPITAGELSKITGLSTGSVTALINRLEKSGYVKRERDQLDGRKVMIMPIPERQEQIKSHYQSLSMATKELCSAYNEQELILINQFVEEITKIMDKENDKLMSERER